jgi:hypothetical protein
VLSTFILHLHCIVLMRRSRGGGVMEEEEGNVE